MKLLVWMAIWISGCVVFDRLPGLRGAWLMGGGAVTYMVCEIAMTITPPTTDGPEGGA